MSYNSPEVDRYLAHYGVKGQKHGQRRYQNEDGTLTPEGRAHYGVEERQTAQETRDQKIRQTMIDGRKGLMDQLERIREKEATATGFRKKILQRSVRSIEADIKSFDDWLKKH